MEVSLGKAFVWIHIRDKSAWQKLPSQKINFSCHCSSDQEGLVNGETEWYFASGMALQLEFTSSELRCRDMYMKSAEEGVVSTAGGAKTIKAEEKNTAKERNGCVLSGTCTLHLSTIWSRISSERDFAPGQETTENTRADINLEAKFWASVCLTDLTDSGPTSRPLGSSVWLSMGTIRKLNCWTSNTQRQPAGSFQEAVAIPLPLWSANDWLRALDRLFQNPQEKCLWSFWSMRTESTLLKSAQWQEREASLPQFRAFYSAW